MPRILIVDDDLGVLRALGRLIHFMPRSALGGDAQVECHDDPEQALARVQAVEFDLVIVDYLMPKLHGVGFMRRLDALHSHAARLLLSGHARVLERIEADRDYAQTLGRRETVPRDLASGADATASTFAVATTAVRAPPASEPASAGVLSLLHES